MLKLAAAVTVVAAATGIGRQLGSNLERRPGQLRDCIVIVQALESEIGYAATPLPEAVRRAGAGAGGELEAVLAVAAAQMAAGADAAAAWQAMLVSVLGHTALRPDDTAVLAPLGTQLGRSDIADQLRHLQLARAGLERQLAKADAERSRLGRLYKYAGPLAGCAAVVLLF